MIVSLARTGAWLLIQAARTDTVLMRQVGQEHAWYEVPLAIAALIALLALIVVLIAFVPAAWSFRKSYGLVTNLTDKLYADANPLMRHATAIADNVNYVTTAVRADVQLVHGTIVSANERIQQAVALTEERLNELNALIAVVQEEAESMFVATASTVRGVRTGAAAFHHEDEEAASRMPVAESEELDDGNNDSDASEAGPARPRVRPRRRGWA
ncbi:MAG: hypothetical protein ABJE47_11500 [bacterium]